MGFLRHITGQRVVRREDGTLMQVSADKVLEKTGTQSLRAYIDMSQTAVAKWVVLRPILEVCDRETSYKGGGRRRYPKWRQKASRKQLSCTLKEILASAMEQRWKSGRFGGRGQYREAEESEDEAGNNGSWDAGTETGEAQVGEGSFVAARRKYTGKWPGAGAGTLPRQKSGGGQRRAVRLRFTSRGRGHQLHDLLHLNLASYGCHVTECR